MFAFGPTAQNLERERGSLIGLKRRQSWDLLYVCHKWKHRPFSSVCSCSQEQSGVVLDLLRRFHHLKLILSTVVENALTVAHNLPDHNHNAQEAKKTFTRVSAFYVFLKMSQIVACNLYKTWPITRLIKKTFKTFMSLCHLIYKKKFV